MRALSGHVRPLAAACLLGLAGPALAADLADGVQLHGFISQGYLHTAGTDWFGDTSGHGTFEFDEAAVSVSAQPVDRLRLGVQVLARAMADSGDNKVEIDWAYADYRLRRQVGFKAGRFKMPYGLYNESRDIDFDHPSIFLPLCIYQPQLRDYMLAIQGGMVYGSLDAGAAGQLDYNLYGGGQRLDTEGDLATYLSHLGIGDSFSSISIKEVVGTALTWRAPVEGLRFRLSGLLVKNFDAMGRSEAQPVPGAPGVFADQDIHTHLPSFWNGVASVEYQRRALTISAEWLRSYARSIIDVTAHPYTMVPMGPGTVRVDLPATTTNTELGSHFEGMYLSVAYRVLDRLELSASNQLRLENDGDDRTWAFAGRYDILDNWLVKAEWQLHHGSALATEGMPQTWTLFAARTTVDF